MTVTVVVDLPDEDLNALGAGTDQFTRELRLAAAVKWFELGKLSQERAAAVAGLSRRVSLDALDAFGVSPFQLTPDELKREVLDVVLNE